jgi:L-alanine-DL-glutamate epimerase-like enolase superfamily enzyme
MTQLKIKRQQYPIAGSFSISRGTKTTADVVVAELHQDGYSGHGECVPYARYNETIDRVEATLQRLVDPVAAGLDRVELQNRLAPGAARNALDCAFWDLEAKRTGTSVYQLLELPPLQPLTTAYTLSLDTPEKMGAAAKKNAHRPLLKIKLAGQADLERVTAIRQNAPNTRLIVDANEGWQATMVEPFSAKLAALGVALIEQPLPADADTVLAELDHPVPLCADESCHTASDVALLADRYDLVNIKLDKTGGLTQALKLMQAAGANGLGTMVGCMVGTSLGMAPAVLLAQEADYVDLDGPLLLAQDCEHGLQYAGSVVYPPLPALWG